MLALRIMLGIIVFAAVAAVLAVAGHGISADSECFAARIVQKIA